VVPALDGTRQFHARVAANVLAIVGRELATGDDALRAERRRLTTLLDASDGEEPETAAALAASVRALNETLAERIRRGDADAEAVAGRRPHASPADRGGASRDRQPIRCTTRRARTMRACAATGSTSGSRRSAAARRSC
jgi:hypothetical protein